MKRATPSLLLSITVLLSVCFGGVREGCNTFALPKQASSRVQRQREGLGIHSSAGERFDWLVNETDLVLDPTLEEKRLAL